MGPAEIIVDPDDPRIEAYRRLRERDLAGRDGLFVAEGRVVLEKLVRAGRYPIRSILVAAQRLGSLEGLLAQAPASTPVYVAAQAVMDAIVGFPIHRGILALGERARLAPEALLASVAADGVLVGLCGISNHDNMGGVFRNAAAFGAAGLLLDAHCCDPLYRKAVRVSVGASLTTPFARLERGADVPETLAAAGFEVVALSPVGATELKALRRCGRIAMLLGAEGPAPEVLSRVRTVRIAMPGGFDSLNVATTSGIVLHHLTTP